MMKIAIKAQTAVILTGLMFLVSMFLLSGCSGTNDETASANQNVATSPKIPKTKIIQADITKASDTTEKTTKSYDDETYMEDLIGRINKDLDKLNIAAKDIELGWYYAGSEGKKYGTPDSWVFVNEGGKSYWISPTALDTMKDIEIDELCRDTSGYYVISCIEREIPHCEHISESECRCSENTKWVDKQGCILLDEDDKYVNISNDELNQGWYYGQKSEKKLNTPSSWVWTDNDKKSRWHNPSPKR